MSEQACASCGILIGPQHEEKIGYRYRLEGRLGTVEVAICGRCSILAHQRGYLLPGATTIWVRTGMGLIPRCVRPSCYPKAVAPGVPREARLDYILRNSTQG